MTASWAPATEARRKELQSLMQESANSRSCWCTYWYLPNAKYKAAWGRGSDRVLKGKLADGDEPGIIAYIDGTPAAWVSVVPRTDFDRLNRSRHFAPIDDLAVWAVNCFVVAKPFRRQGLLPMLAGFAADFAFGKGAPGVEAYPIEPSEKSGSADLYLGTVNAFRAAGYVEMARPLPRRPIMRRMRPA